MVVGAAWERDTGVVFLVIQEVGFIFVHFHEVGNLEVCFFIDFVVQEIQNRVCVAGFGR